MKPRVVFDCMVFLQGAGRPAGPARACFRLVDEEQVTLCLSSEILNEVRDVLTRPRTLRRFPLLSSEWVERFLQNVAGKAVVLTEVPKTFTLERDPKDEPYLNLALAVQARYLVSRDRDLLDLMKETSFRERVSDLTILDPAAFLQALSAARQQQPPSESESEGDPQGRGEPEAKPTPEKGAPEGQN